MPPENSDDNGGPPPSRANDLWGHVTSVEKKVERHDVRISTLEGVFSSHAEQGTRELEKIAVSTDRVLTEMRGIHTRVTAMEAASAISRGTVSISTLAQACGVLTALVGAVAFFVSIAK